MNPILADRMVRWGARAATRSAPGPNKQYAAAIGVSRSRASRHKSGDPYAPAVKNLKYIDQLARSEHTSAWAQISEEMAVAKRVGLETKSTEELKTRLHELMAGEHARQAAQDAALQEAALTGDYTVVADMCLSHCDVLLEIAAHSDEIAERMERGR